MMIKRLINWYKRPIAAEPIKAGQTYYLFGGKAYPREEGELTPPVGTALYTTATGQRVVEQSTLSMEQILNHIDGLREAFLSSGTLPSDVTSANDLAGWLDDIAYTAQELMADIKAAQE